MLRDTSDTTSLTDYDNAQTAHRAGRLDEAEQLYLKVLSAQPSHAPSLYQLALIEHSKGRCERALQRMQEAQRAAPTDPAIALGVGNLHREAQQLTAAQAAYEQALALNPDYLPGIVNLASLKEALRNHTDALALYRRAVELSPEDSALWNSLGIAFKDAGMTADAERALGEAIRLAPQSPHPASNLGALMMQSGDTDKALSQFKHTIDRFPQFARAHENYIRAKRFDADDVEDQDYVAQLERLTSATQAASESRMLFHFCLGKILDDCNEFDRAFEHYTQGNDIVRSLNNFDPEKHQHWIDTVIDTFDLDFFSRTCEYGSDSTVPIFIVGMVRSGTTLVERIIASHPDAFGAGELDHLSTIANDVASRQQQAYPNGFNALDKLTVQSMAEKYLSKLPTTSAERIADKLPGNFLYLGLVATLFPNCKIIHCERSPLDVCLSTYFQRFTHGHSYAYALSHIGAYYIEYRRLMKHWQHTLPLNIHTVQYEDLVTTFEPTVRQLLDYLALPWDARCLTFHRSRDAVRTASEWQVRQPIYARSAHRWRNYETQLAPFRRQLESAGIDL